MRETRTGKKYISETAFRKWIKAMYDQFMESSAVVQTRKNYTYVYLRSKVGVAKCNSTDTFDRKTGIAYAWARCTGQPEYYMEEKYIPKAGEWVLVNTTNNATIFLKYLVDGVDNYCFRTPNGRLILIDKDRVTKFLPTK